jgi:DNA-directed RNA polymerase specialized sigma24 family protein
LQNSAPSAGYFALLLERIEGGSQDAAYELRLHYFRGIKYLLVRQLGPDRSDELAQAVFTTVIDAIHNGKMRQPEHLAGFVRTVVHRTIAAEVAARYPRQSNVVPESDLVSADRALRSLSSRDREVLMRFYAQRQSAEEICREMGLTATQFQLIRNRAKDSFTHD